MRVNRDRDSTWHAAKWIMVTPSLLLENAAIEVHAGKIVRTETGRTPHNRNVTDHGHGLLMAAPVNAHTHLELSSLRGKTTLDNGMLTWVQSLIQARDRESEEAMEEGLRTGVKESINSHLSLFADVFNSPRTPSLLFSCPIYSWSFKEFLGHSLPDWQRENRFFTSVSRDHAHGTAPAVHAPHTTNGDVIQFIKRYARANRMPLSMHLAESREEVEFIATGKGQWADFLSERGLRIVISNKGLTPVAYADSLGMLDDSTLAVHLTTASRQDLEIIKTSGANVCLCPRSNYRIMKRLPPLDEILDLGIAPALGTDSLASVESLSIWDEMAFVMSKYPRLDPKILLEMATINGANALGAGEFLGDLLPGKKAYMVQLDLEAANAGQVYDMVVHNGGRAPRKRIGEM